MKQYDIAIIGGGPAGYSAALYCARAGFTTAVLEQLAPGGQMSTTNEIDNYPGFDDTVDGFDLAEKMQRGAERFGAVTEIADVTSVQLAGDTKLLKTSEGDFEARAVIIATGAAPRELGVAHEKELRGRGVTYCATCDGRMYKDKTVVVVGGGNTAAADALFLAKLCKKVYLVHRRDSLRATRLYIDALQKMKNVEFVWNSQVAEFLYDAKVQGVVVKNVQTGKTRRIEAEGIFVAVGRVPNTAMFQGQLELDDAGYIVADESTRTSLPGVYAVGDVRTKVLRQIVTAAADGAVASHYIEEYLA